MNRNVLPCVPPAANEASHGTAGRTRGGTLFMGPERRASPCVGTRAKAAGALSMRGCPPFARLARPPFNSETGIRPARLRAA